MSAARPDRSSTLSTEERSWSSNQGTWEGSVDVVSTPTTGRSVSVRPRTRPSSKRSAAARSAPAIRRRSRTSTTASRPDRKSTRLNSSHTEIYTLSLHDALPIGLRQAPHEAVLEAVGGGAIRAGHPAPVADQHHRVETRSEEHTSELQSHRDLHSFPTRRSSDRSPSGPARGRPRSGRRRRDPRRPSGAGRGPAPPRRD